MRIVSHFCLNSAAACSTAALKLGVFTPAVDDGAWSTSPLLVTWKLRAVSSWHSLLGLASSCRTQPPWRCHWSGWECEQETTSKKVWARKPEGEVRCASAESLCLWGLGLCPKTSVVRKRGWKYSSPVRGESSSHLGDVAGCRLPRSSHRGETP